MVDTEERGEQGGERADAASCGSHLAVQRRYPDAGILPAALLDIRRWQACFSAALRAAGWRDGRPHPAGSSVARRTNRSAGILAGGACRSDNLTLGAPITVMRKFWTTRNVTFARGCDHCPRWKGAGQGCPAPEWSIAQELKAAGRRRRRAIPAARRAALKLVSQCPAFPNRARRMRASG